MLVGEILAPTVTIISILPVTDSNTNEIINFQMGAEEASIVVDSVEMLDLL